MKQCVYCIGELSIRTFVCCFTMYIPLCFKKVKMYFKITLQWAHNNSPLQYKLYSLCIVDTVYPKKYAHAFCFAVLCCGYTLTDFPISIRLTSLALWQSNDCPSASKATLMNMDKYFMWIHYEQLHNHNKAKHNKTVCIFLGIYCIYCIATKCLFSACNMCWWCYSQWWR